MLKLLNFSKICIYGGSPTRNPKILKVLNYNKLYFTLSKELVLFQKCVLSLSKSGAASPDLMELPFTSPKPIRPQKKERG